MRTTALTGLFLFFSGLSGAQGVWTQKASLPDTARLDAMSFSVGNKGYITQGGNVNMTRLYSVWEYDATSNSWTQKQNFAGPVRWQGVSFTIGSKGYIGTGQDPSSMYNNDLWEYDPVSDTWTQKASLPAISRNMAIGFSIGSKGYVGLGTTVGSGSVNDFWEYDAALNTWTQKANFPCPAGRFSAAGLSIGPKGYAGMGMDQYGTRYDDFWEYDPATDTWTQKSNFPPGTREEVDGAHFSVGNSGYVGTGRTVVSSSWVYYNDFWKYAPATDTWTQIPSLPSTPRIGASSFVINNLPYVGMGHNGYSTAFNDLWSYNPDVKTDVEDVLPANTLSIFPNPFSRETTISAGMELHDATLETWNMSGAVVGKIENISGRTVHLQRGDLPCGVYFVRLSQDEQTIATGKLMVVE